MSSVLILAAVTKLMFGDGVAPAAQRDFAGFRYVESTDETVCTKGAAGKGVYKGWSFKPGTGATWHRPDNGTVPADRLLEHGTLVLGDGEVKVPFKDGPCVVHVWVGDWFRGPQRLSSDAGDVRLVCDGRTVYTDVVDGPHSYREWCRFDDYVFNRNDSQWDRIVKTVYREFDFPATAKDGAVTLVGNNLLLAAVAVASNEDEMKATLAEVESARRKMFAERYPWRPQPDEELPPGVKADGGLVFFQKGGYDRVCPWTRPRAEEVTDTVRAFAARGEQEMLRFGVLPLEDFAKLELEIGDFRTADGATIASAKAVAFWQERYKETGSEAGDGAINDMRRLDPVSYVFVKPRPIPAEKGTPRMYVADVTVPEDAAAGDYFADVRIRRDGKVVRTTRLQLKVLPFRLRTESAATYGFQMIYNLWAERSNDQWAYGGRVCRFVEDYGFSSFLLVPSVAFGKVTGELGEAKFTQTPKHIETMDRFFRMMNPNGRTKFIWAEPKTIFKRCGWKGYDPSFDVRNDSTWTKEKQEKWAKARRDILYLIGEMDRIFKERGYPEIWWYVGGEPDKFGIGFVKLAAELADSIRRLGAKAKSVLMGPMGAKMFPGHYDHLWGNPATPLTEEFRTTCLSKGTGFGVHNGGDTRFQAGFQFWRTHAEGRYQETQFYTGFMAPYVYLPWNWNTAQVYPTPDGGLAPILPFLNYRDGRDDYLYLHTLEEMIAEAPAGSAARKDAEELIAHLTKKIHFDPRAYHNAFYDGIEATASVKMDEWNADSIERYRWAAAKRIMALGEAASRRLDK